MEREYFHQRLQQDEELTLTNSDLLSITTCLFSVFLVAEMIGAYWSNSLALWGDTLATLVDVFACCCNLYAERVKLRQTSLDSRTMQILEVYIPVFCVAFLLIITGWIICSAVYFIMKGSDSDQVDLKILIGFSIVSFAIDIGLVLMFYYRRTEILFSASTHKVLNNQIVKLEEETEDEARVPRANLNMLSVLTHIGGDALRTISVFSAAMISVVFNLNSSQCDAWASIIVSISILFGILPLLYEIFKSGFIGKTEPKLKINVESYTSSSVTADSSPHTERGYSKV